MIPTPTLPILPHGDHVLLVRDPADTMTKGGIALPDIAQDRPCRGIVLAAGEGLTQPDGTRARPELALGDVVRYAWGKGTEVEVAGVELTVVRVDHIVGVETKP